jgi:hypothetical protein
MRKKEKRREEMGEVTQREATEKKENESDRGAKTRQNILGEVTKEERKE